MLPRNREEKGRSDPLFGHTCKEHAARIEVKILGLSSPFFVQWKFRIPRNSAYVLGASINAHGRARELSVLRLSKKHEPGFKEKY